VINSRRLTRANATASAWHTRGGAGRAG
jgi:hypothetical protein